MLMSKRNRCGAALAFSVGPQAKVQLVNATVKINKMPLSSIVMVTNDRDAQARAMEK